MHRFALRLLWRAALEGVPNVSGTAELPAAGEQQGSLVVPGVAVVEVGELVPEVDGHEQVLRAAGVAEAVKGGTA